MQVTIMSYNIMTGSYGPYGLEGVARIIEKYQPDIVGLQEVNSGRRAVDWLNQPRWLGERLNMEWAFGAAEKNVMYHDKIREYGNALLSRFPIVRLETRLLPTEHREPNLSLRQPRGILAVTLDLGEFHFNAFVTHWGLSTEQRLLQARETAEIVKGWHPENPAFLVGDMNALPDAPEIEPLNKEFIDALANLPEDKRYTYPSGAEGTRTPNGWYGAIDYVYGIRGSKPLHAEVIFDETLASDHNPLLVKFEVEAASVPRASQQAATNS